MKCTSLLTGFLLLTATSIRALEPVYTIDVTNPPWGNAPVIRNTITDVNADRINALVGLLPPEGGTLFFPHGTYLIRSSILINSKKNVSFIGEANGSVIMTDQDPTSTYSASDFALIKANNSPNLLFRDLILVGPKKNYSSDNVQTPGIYLTSRSDSSRIQSCRFSDLNSGIRIENSSDCQVTNNLFTGKIVQDGVQIMSLSTLPPPTQEPYWCQRNVVSNNTFSFTASPSSMGVRLAGQSNEYRARSSVVMGNTIKNAGLEAIVGEFAEKSSIVGNSISNSGYGIQLYEHKNGTISSNVIEDCPHVGIGLYQNSGQTYPGGQITNNVISGNSIKNCGSLVYEVDSVTYYSHGISIAPPPGQGSADSNLVLNNIIKSPIGNGISISAKYCIVKGNHIQSPGEMGIGLANATHALVESNFIMQPGTHGIFGGSHSIISGNYVIAKASPQANTGGIWLEGYENVTVTGNKVTGYGAFNEYIPTPISSSYGNTMLGNSSGTNVIYSPDGSRTTPLLKLYQRSDNPSDNDYLNWGSLWGPVNGGIRAGGSFAWDTQIWGADGLSLRGGSYDGANPDVSIRTGKVGIGVNQPSAKLDVNGSVKSGTGAWNAGHLIMGNYHFWIDSNGKLRMKNGAPTSATDGTVVGSQS